jgi:hypothetical protein
MFSHADRADIVCRKRERNERKERRKKSQKNETQAIRKMRICVFCAVRADAIASMNETRRIFYTQRNIGRGLKAPSLAHYCTI